MAKTTITFKTPDVLDQLDQDDREKLSELINQYVKFGELITIEFDTALETAKVLKAQ